MNVSGVGSSYPYMGAVASSSSAQSVEAAASDLGQDGVNVSLLQGANDMYGELINRLLSSTIQMQISDQKFAMLGQFVDVYA